MIPSQAMSYVVIDQLIRAGIRDIVLSPGSRSAPLALECAAAERRGDVQLHVRIDERSAGFLGLGLAKASGAPVAVLCTSGSAVANLAPAVVEASYAGVPLIVITADRPPELRNTGANQTIDQVGFFGSQVRHAQDIGPAVNQPGQAKQWRRGIVRAIEKARAVGFEGPIHINIALREPLLLATDEPWCEPFDLDVPQCGERVQLLREPVDFTLADLGSDHVPTRGLVLVGDVRDPAEARAASELAEACGWPIISEPSGNVSGGQNHIDHAPLVLMDADFVDSHQPDLLVSVGRFGLSRTVMKCVAGAKQHIVVALSGKDIPDPLHSAAITLKSVPLPPSRTSTIAWDGPDVQWLAQWQSAATTVAQRIETILADATGDGEYLCGPSIARAVTSSLTSDDILFVAASRPVRDVEAFAVAGSDGPRVVGNRGASGIDGLISTAWGVATATGKRTVALLGDLAFLHDHNGLLAPDVESKPNLTIVVADNNGGGIFSSLEQGAPEFEQDFERVFGTPHGKDLVAIAAATGSEATRVTTIDELTAGLKDSASTDHVKVLVAATISREAEAELQRKLQGSFHRK